MRYFLYLLCSVCSLLGASSSLTAAVSSQDVYALQFKTLDEAPMPLSQYRGKVLLIVNTASQCGFTPQYEGLQKLYDTYKDRGLVVIGVPSNDFGNQEPGSAEEIKQFTSDKFHVTFPLTAKEEVRGKGAHPFFRQVRSELGVFAPPLWNFYKYIVGRDGHLVAWFSSKTSPTSESVTQAIETELNRKPLD